MEWFRALERIKLIITLVTARTSREINEIKTSLHPVHPTNAQSVRKQTINDEHSSKYNLKQARQWYLQQTSSRYSC